jgi:hypothetical protein
MARKRNKVSKRAWIGLAVLGVVLFLTLGANAISLVIAAFVIGFIVFAQFVIGPHVPEIWGRVIIRDDVPQQPSQPSLSAQLDDLTAAFQSGRITEDEYNQRRASIIQSS